jgi:regulator of protease activity HflC (stomatin/prohibitin superfamily)
LLVLGAGVLFLFLILLSGKLIENVDNSEIVVIQSLTGKMYVCDQPGPVFQNFGTATHYKKSKQFWFSKHTDEGSNVDQSVKIQFNEGGHGTLSGSLRWYMPTDHNYILKLHSDYHSQEGIEQELIRQVITKAIYFTGPLMSSKESSAERRNDLLSYIEDQAINGVYKTDQKDVKTHDELTNTDKTVIVVTIVKDSKGLPIRQEKSALSGYNISIKGLALNSIDYSKEVEEQIKLQQSLVMQVQTSIANARKSEQDAITTEQKGKADAAKAKWDQEVIKAQLVTEAQQKREVAELEAQTAKYVSQKIKIEVDAKSYANAKLVAAGLTPQERAQFEKDTKIGVAEALSKIQLPTTYMSGNSQGGGNSMLESLLGVKLLEK